MSDFLDKAFSSHAAVKARLRKSILGQADLDASVIRRDDVCVVGQWIYGEGGAKHRSNALFEQFKTVHAEFHQEAYKAMMLASQGDNARALAAIEQGGFQKKSAEIAQCIGKMKKDPAFK